MRNFISILCISLICMCINSTKAQNRDIKLPAIPKKAAYVDYTDKDKGFWSAIEITGGSMADFNKRDLPFAEASTINGYRVNEFLRAGIGIGIKYYINNDDVRSSSIPCTFPLFADFRGNIISQESRTSVPYWTVDIGGEIRDGFFFSPTIGVRFGEKRSSFLLGISYSYNEIKTYENNKEGRNILSLKLGYEF